MSTTQNQEQSTPIIDENLPAVVNVDKNDSQIFSVLDRLDDELILAELDNRVVTEWVYRFNQDGKEVCNLSKAGVDACCTEMARDGHIIEEDEVRYSQDPSDPEYFLFTVIARRVLIDENGDRKVMETVNGAKRQCTKMPKGKPNNFWFEQGCMKACRNARNRLIPERVKATILAAAKMDGRVRHVTEKDVERTSQPVREEKPKQQPQRANHYANRADIEEWIALNLGDTDEHKKQFKKWAASFPTSKIGKNEFGHLTLDKVDMTFASRLIASPDDAAANFSIWYDREKAKTLVTETFEDSEVVDNEPA